MLDLAPGALVVAQIQALCSGFDHLLYSECGESLIAGIESNPARIPGGYFILHTDTAITAFFEIVGVVEDEGSIEPRSDVVLHASARDLRFWASRCAGAPEETRTKLKEKIRAAADEMNAFIEGVRQFIGVATERMRAIRGAIDAVPTPR